MNQVLTRYMAWTALALAWAALFAALILADHRVLWICALSAFSAGFLAFDSAATLLYGLVHWTSEAARQPHKVQTVIDNGPSEPAPPPSPPDRRPKGPPPGAALAPLSTTLPVYQNQSGRLRIDHDRIHTENSEVNKRHPRAVHPPYTDDLDTADYPQVDELLEGLLDE